MNNTTTSDGFNSHRNHNKICLSLTKKKIKKEGYNARNRELHALEQGKICSLQVLDTKGNNF